MVWLQKFKERNNYQLRTLYGEIYESNLIDTKEFLDIMQQKLIEYSRNNIYNMNETGLFYKLFRSKTVCKSVREGYKILKDRVSIGLCRNFFETHIMKPLIIGKTANPRCFCNWKQRTTNYTSSKRGWMTREVFRKRLKDNNDEMKLNKKNSFAYR
ncbi:Tigger transposable element-derived protein 6 [Cucumispora dikerogammari]|nr:Tigger transposable element-derived protein 6 [Cucumispora dikerogammari]